MGISLWHPRKRGKDPSASTHYGADTKKPNTGSSANPGIDQMRAVPESRVLSRTSLPSHRSSLQPHPLALVPPSRNLRSLSMPIPATLLNDPAFSADPRLNPHYVPAHSTIELSRNPSLPQPVTPNQHELNSTPVTPAKHHSSASVTYKSPTPQSPTTSPSASSSSSSHSSIDSSPPSSSPPSPPSPSPPISPTPPRTSSPQPPSCDDPFASHVDSQDSEDPRPKSPQSVSLPKVRRAVQRPMQSIRPNSTPREVRLHRSTSRHLSHIQELDRIDELDESDPLGLPWHHGGPYEAARKVSQDPTHWKGSTVNGIDGQKQRASKASRYIHNGGVGVSLNIVPGQIMPRYDPAFIVPPHPLCQPLPRDPTFRSYELPHFPPHLNPPGDYPSYDPYLEYSQQNGNIRRASPDLDEQGMGRSHPSAPHDYDQRHLDADYAFDPVPSAVSSDPGHMNRRGSRETGHRVRFAEFHDIPHSVDPSDPRHHQPQNPGHPLINSQIPLSLQPSVVPDARRAPTSKIAPQNLPPQGMSSTPEQYVDTQHSEPNAPTSRTPNHSPNHPSVDARGNRPPHPDASASNVARSVSTNRSGLPPNRHLPKHLIMPAPLRSLHQEVQVYEPIQPLAVPDPYPSVDISTSLRRAQDIPIRTGNRKLTKRATIDKRSSNSHSPTEFGTVPAANKDGHRDSFSYAQDTKNRLPKKVLSKRRHD